MVAGSRRRGAALLVLAGLAAALVVSATTAGAAPDARRQVTLSPEAAEAACPGDLIAIPPAVDGAPPMCTHGPDPAVTPDLLSAEAGTTPEASAGIQCYGNGTSGNRVQLLYAYASSNRINTFRPWIEDRAAAIDATYDASARQTGGRRFVRWLTDTDCNLTITAVQVPSAALVIGNFNTAGGLIEALQNRGFTRQDRKYLVWADTGTPTGITNGTCSGIGTMYIDPKPTPGATANSNFNDRFGGYTRVDDKCLFPVFDSVRGKVEAHELMHTLGAVQPTAPHATVYGHCRDDYDIMCYVDGPGSSLISPRPCPTAAEELLLDCRNDDYFSTAPAAGSYLANNWNSADSSWLEREPGAPQPPGPPGPPGPVAGVPGSSSVALTWTAPQSDGGTPIVGYRVYRNDSLVAPTTTSTRGGPNAAVTTTTPSFTDSGLVDGTTYRYQVVAVNAQGESPRTAAVSVMAGVPRPDAQVGVAKRGPFQFDGLYATSMTGNAQVVERPVARGGSVTFFVRIQNDRPGADTFRVKGVASGAAGYTVRYLRGTTDITSQVVAGTYTVTDVPAGGHVDMRVKVKASTTTARNSVRSVTVTVRCKSVKTVKDVVQVRARRS